MIGQTIKDEQFTPASTGVPCIRKRKPYTKSPAEIFLDVWYPPPFFLPQPGLVSHRKPLLLWSPPRIQKRGLLLHSKLGIEWAWCFGSGGVTTFDEVPRPSSTLSRLLFADHKRWSRTRLTLLRIYLSQLTSESDDALQVHNCSCIVHSPEPIRTSLMTHDTSYLCCKVYGKV